MERVVPKPAKPLDSERSRHMSSQQERPAVGWAAEQRLRLVLDSVSDGIIDVDGEGRAALEVWRADTAAWSRVHGGA